MTSSAHEVPTSEARSNGVQSVLRAAQLLSALRETHRGATLTELGEVTGLHKSTAHRLLATLRETGFVRYLPVDGLYVLGTELLRLGDAARHQILPGAQAHTFLVALRDETGETVHLGVPDESGLVYADKVESTQAVRIASRVGASMALHCTSLGKSYLAFQPQARIESFLAGAPFPVRTERTITQAPKLRSELGRVRAQGYAIDDRENEEDMRCVAAPILDSDGIALAAVSVSAPANRVPQSRIPALSEAVQRAAGAISADVLGDGGA